MTRTAREDIYRNLRCAASSATHRGPLVAAWYLGMAEGRTVDNYIEDEALGDWIQGCWDALERMAAA